MRAAEMDPLPLSVWTNILGLYVSNILRKKNSQKVKFAFYPTFKKLLGVVLETHGISICVFPGSGKQF